MKSRNRFAALLTVFGLGASLVTSLGQVILNPNQLSGNVSFNNSTLGVLVGLQAPGNEGMSNIFVQASSLPPAPPIVAATSYLPVNTRLDGDYEITVDSDNPGISYSVSPRVLMQGDRYVYYFANKTSAPVTIGSTPPPLNFQECVGVVTVKFITAGGAPVAVDGGSINAYSLPDMNYSGQRSGIPAGATQQTIYLRGGQSHRLDITVNRGTDFYTDRIESFLMTNVVATCDGFTFIAMVIPSAGTLATINGNVDLLGEFELTVEANPAYDSLADYTSVIARYGPFGNQRWNTLTGANFTAPSSGAFSLANVVPSTLDPASPGYSVFAQMVLRTNRMIEIFNTPALNSGLNPALPVAPGDSVDLTNLFVIDPGFLRGSVLLQGPAESLGRPSLLRGMVHAGDDDLDADGIPDAIGTYGIYGATVHAAGVDRLASGATFTASGGYGYGDFPGAFNPANSAYEGQYELVLGGLLSEASIWKQKYLTVVLSSGTVTNDNDYYYNTFTITELDTNDVEIIPTQATTNDIAYCMSEVKVVFRSTSGTFYSPNFRSSIGAFTNTDFLGQPANYRVDVGAMYGTPSTVSAAANIGQVVMYLPQGDYTLNPYVTTDGGSDTGLPPIDVSVGCGQVITLEPCLQMILNAPDCTKTSVVQIAGSVLSCTNNIASISYTLNDGPPQVLCDNCGPDPAFAFSLNLNDCDNTLTVTATNNFGGVSSVTTTIRYDNAPPVINCPADIEASAGIASAISVNYSVTATDNCPGPVSVVCTPPSGTVFPIGTHTVTCVATDHCGNTNQCQFKVIVQGCLAVFLEPPVCTANFGFIGYGSATSCDGMATNLEVRVVSLSDTNISLAGSSITLRTYSTNFLRMSGQLFPEFDGRPRSAYSNLLWTVTARDKAGRVAVRQWVNQYDFIPPTIQCPSNITVTAADGVSAVVNYSFTAYDDCPSCPILTRTIPPSGSSFSVGTHTVTCVASDLCNNTNTCTFQVTVLPPAPPCPLTINLSQPSPPEVTLTWDCGGTLQSAADLAGPWSTLTGATSPYTTAANDAQRFYRLNSSTAGAALQFPGTAGAYTSTAFPQVLNPFSGFTIAAWVKTSQSTGAYPGIVTKYLGGSSDGYGLALNAGRLAPWYYGNATYFVEPGFSGPSDRFIADGLWHHVAFAVNTTSGRTFIDGQLVNTQPWTGSPITTFTTEPLRFGYYPGGGGMLFSGEMDDVTVWNVALTDSEISSLMTTPPVGSEPGLQGYWRFDEASGSTTTDWTGRGYNATLGSGVTWTPSTAPISH